MHTSTKPMAAYKDEAQLLFVPVAVLFVSNAYSEDLDALGKQNKTQSINKDPHVRGRKDSLMNSVNHNTSVNCLLSGREILEVLKWAIKTKNASYIESTLDFEALDAETRRLCELVHAACKAAFATFVNERRINETMDALWSHCYVDNNARVLLDMIDEALFGKEVA